MMDRKKYRPRVKEAARVRHANKSVFVDDDRIYEPDEIEFGKAMDDYKRANRRPFPTWSEVLQVLKDLGYVKS